MEKSSTSKVKLPCGTVFITITQSNKVFLHGNYKCQTTLQALANLISVCISNGVPYKDSIDWIRCYEASRVKKPTCIKELITLLEENNKDD